MSLKSTHSNKLQEKLFMTWAAHTFHSGLRSTEGFNGFLETREIEVSESQPEFNDNPLRPPFTTKNMVGSLRRLASNGFIFKVSSRVKNHHLPNFQAHQELSFKKKF